MDCLDYINSPGQSHSLLVIDDSRPFLEGFEAILKANKIYSTSVLDGFDALDTARRRRFDAIVLDWCMPDLDGSHTIQFLDLMCLRDSVNAATFPPVIICTSKRAESVELPATKIVRVIDIWQKDAGWVELSDKVRKLEKQLRQGDYGW